MRLGQPPARNDSELQRLDCPALGLRLNLCVKSPRLTSDAHPDPIRQLAVAALGGVILGLSGGRRGSGWLRLLGVTLVGVALRPIVEERVRRAGSERRSLASRASINIDRPVRDVFAFFKDFENLPRIFGALRSVVDYQDGRSHWELYVPSGHETLEWDAVVTKYVPAVRRTSKPRKACYCFAAACGWIVI